MYLKSYGPSVITYLEDTWTWFKTCGKWRYKNSRRDEKCFLSHSINYDTSSWTLKLWGKVLSSSYDYEHRFSWSFVSFIMFIFYPPCTFINTYSFSLSLSLSLSNVSSLRFITPFINPILAWNTSTMAM